MGFSQGGQRSAGFAEVAGASAATDALKQLADRSHMDAIAATLLVGNPQRCAHPELPALRPQIARQDIQRRLHGPSVRLDGRVNVPASRGHTRHLCGRRRPLLADLGRGRIRPSHGHVRKRRRRLQSPEVLVCLGRFALFADARQHHDRALQLHDRRARAAGDTARLCARTDRAGRSRLYHRAIAWRSVIERGRHQVPPVRTSSAITLTAPRRLERCVRLERRVRACASDRGCRCLRRCVDGRAPTVCLGRRSVDCSSPYALRLCPSLPPLCPACPTCLRSSPLSRSPRSRSPRRSPVASPALPTSSLIPVAPVRRAPRRRLTLSRRAPRPVRRLPGCAALHSRLR